MPDKRRIARLYVAFQFFFDMLIWLPVFFEFQRRMGLSDAQILSIQSMHYLAFCLLDVPTGYFADRIGYRNTMRAGAGIFTFSNVLVIFTPTYAGFFAHFFLVALARSLISGAANAYAYEWYKSLGAKDEYKTLEGRARAASLAGKVISWAAVGSLMAWHVTLPYWLTALSAAIAFCIALAMPVLPLQHRMARLERRMAAFRDVRNVFASLTRSPFLVLIVLQGVGVFLLGRMQVTFFQPILSDKGFDAVTFGWIMSFMTAFEALGAAYPGWIKRRLSDLNSVFALTAGIAASFFAIALTGKIGAIAGFCLFSYLMGIVYPVQKQLINDNIADPSRRATLLSIESMTDRAVSASVIALLSGYAGAGQTGILLIWTGVGTIVGMALLFAAVRFTATPLATPAKTV